MMILSKNNVSDEEQQLIKTNRLYPGETLNKKDTSKYVEESVFENGLRVGNSVSFARIIISIIVIALISAFLTGFGYQPFWLFLLVFFIGVFLTLPACFNSYWVIYSNKIIIYNFSKNGFVKLGQLFGLVKKSIFVLNLDDISVADIEYLRKKRVSPFDITSDHFKIDFELKNEKRLFLSITKDLTPDILKLVHLLNHHGIDVYDQQKTVELLNKDENLFAYFNSKR